MILPPPPAEARSNLSEKAFRHIKAMILSGSLKGGERIPEERIAGALNVSRTPVREALRKLEEYGLVFLKPRSYSEVVAMGPEEIEKVILVRVHLETLAVRLLAGKSSPEDIDRLTLHSGACLSALARKDLARFFEADSRFHLSIAELTGNAYLHDLMMRLDAKVQLCRLTRCASFRHISRAVKDHEPIIDAIAKHDGKRAVRLMERHAGLIIEIK